MSHVVAEADRLHQILVQAQRAGDTSRDSGRLERMRHPRSVVVTRRIDEDLRLSFQSTERFGVQDPVAVALKRRPHRTLRLVAQPAARLVGADCERREPPLFTLPHALFEEIRDLSGNLGHRG